MKTVMKKLLSVMLVAVMLVSAIPFQASATEGTQSVVQVGVKIGDNIVVSFDSEESYITLVGETSTPSAIIRHRFDGRFAGYAIERVVDDINGGDIDADAEIGNGAKITIRLKAEEEEHTHNYVEKSRKEATCTETGVIYKACSCGDTMEEKLPLKDHTWGDWEVTKPATETEAGIMERSCTVCQAKDPETKEISATGYTLYFNSGNDVETITGVNSGDTLDNLPTPDNKSGYKFAGWYTKENGQGTRLSNGSTWYSDMGQQFYAYYKESTDDGVSTLTVYAKYYVDGSLKDIRELYSQEFTDGDNMFTWLMNNETKTSDAIFEYVSAEDYEWEPRYYYTYSGNEPLEEQDLIADGNKSIVVKVYGKERTKANVLLYVHKEKTSSPTAIYEMNGYTAGDSVTRAAVTTEVKKHYTGKNMTIKGLYTDTTWKQLLNGENPTPSNSITVKDNGTLRIHVLLTNATAGSGSSNADTTNPKTGDTIFVPVIFMLVSGAAIATVYAVSKKRSVK